MLPSLLLGVSIGVAALQGAAFKPSSNPVTDAVRHMAARHARNGRAKRPGCSGW
jgi:hypothetical protein